MAKTWDDTLNELVEKNLKEPGSAPSISVGPKISPYSIVPPRNPNDPLDQAIRTGAANAGTAIMSDIRGNARPLTNTGFDISESAEGAIPTGSAPLGPQMYRAFHRIATAGRPEIGPDQPLFFGGNTPAAINTERYPSAPGYPALQDVSRQALGFPKFQNTDEGINRIAALPDRAPRGAINPNSFGNRWESTADLPSQAINPRDITLAANRSPISYNPQSMGDYEYGGMFNGKPVYFYKPNAQNQIQTLFSNAANAIQEYQRKYPDNPMTTQLNELLTAMNINPNAESARAMNTAHAGLYSAQAGAIPSQMEENRARAKYYGRETPFTLGPGQRAFLPQGEREQAIQIAEGAQEKPGAVGTVDKMDEFDKVRYQGLMHLLQNSLDPEMQKRAASGLDAIEAKYQPKGKPNLPNRDEAYARLKKTGKYTDDQINAKLNALYMQ